MDILLHKALSAPSFGRLLLKTTVRKPLKTSLKLIWMNGSSKYCKIRSVPYFIKSTIFFTLISYHFASSKVFVKFSIVFVHEEKYEALMRERMWWIFGVNFGGMYFIYFISLLLYVHGWKTCPQPLKIYPPVNTDD